MSDLNGESSEENQPDSNCIFCAIASGTTPADIVYQDDTTVFFRDINPKAKVHILGIPVNHVASMRDLNPEHQELAGKLLVTAASVAREQGLDSDGYRIIINAGANANQEVPHLHVHILGGERLGPMKC